MTQQQRGGQQQGRAAAARVRVWLVGHAGELAAVTAPSVVAVTVSPWAWLATVATGGLWARHEVRTRQRVRQAEQRRVTAAASAAAITEETPTDEDATEIDEVSTHG